MIQSLLLFFQVVFIEIVGINKYSNLVLQCGYLFVVFFKNIQLILEQIKKIKWKNGANPH